MYTGPLVEAELLGEITDPERLAQREKEMIKQIGWLTHKQCRENIKEFQPGDPSDPKPRFASDLFATIAEDLCPDDYQKLKYYTAVTSKRDEALKSRLDFFKGVDCFFEFNHDGKKIVITVDVSLLPKEEYKANVFIQIPPKGLDPKEDKREWEQLISEKASEIIDKFHTKIEEGEACVV